MKHLLQAKTLPAPSRKTPSFLLCRVSGPVFAGLFAFIGTAGPAAAQDVFVDSFDFSAADPLLPEEDEEELSMPAPMDGPGNEAALKLFGRPSPARPAVRKAPTPWSATVQSDLIFTSNASSTELEDAAYVSTTKATVAYRWQRTETFSLTPSLTATSRRLDHLEPLQNDVVSFGLAAKKTLQRGTLTLDLTGDATEASETFYDERQVSYFRLHAGAEKVVKRGKHLSFPFSVRVERRFSNPYNSNAWTVSAKAGFARKLTDDLEIRGNLAAEYRKFDDYSPGAADERAGSVVGGDVGLAWKINGCFTLRGGLSASFSDNSLRKFDYSQFNIGPALVLSRQW